MAGFYGMQFEALMKDVCVDFGRKLVKSWDAEADKEEVKKFVIDSVNEFFKRTGGLEMKVEIEKVEESSGEATGGKPKKSRATKKAEEVATKKAPAKSKKPKCEGVTAKGAPCSKCAVEGEVFCSVHLKKAAKEEDKDKSLDKPKSPAKKGKGGKGITRKDAVISEAEEEKKKCEGVTAKGAACSKCVVSGEVFCSVHLKKKKEEEEVPKEEEIENIEEEIDEDAEISEAEVEDKDDVDWVLEEEDFEDLD